MEKQIKLKPLGFKNNYLDPVFIGLGGCGINTIARLEQFNIKASNKILINLPIESKTLLEQLSRELENQDVLIFAGLGGVCGTTLALIVSAIAKLKAKSVGLIITCPFKIEQNRYELAQKVLPILKNMADDILIRENDELIKTYPDYTIEEAFNKMDENLALSFKQN
ncbi:MAG: hypothetical protein N3D10_01110 [Candidatus Micrarchaeota archaeon]|nr:hypothetical protein [Candidatus Micrarchaeota archaeon]